MRTTLNIDDDLLRAARSLAREEGLTLGEAVSKLLRQALTAAPPELEDDGFPVFDVSPDAPPITPEDVARALSDD